MRITLRIPIEQDELTYVLQHYDQIKIYRSTTGRDGIFTEITTSTTRIRISESENLYVFADNDGQPTHYYTTAYYRSSGGSDPETAQSEPMLGDGDSALSLLSVKEVEERYLHGIDLRDGNGKDMTAAAKEFHIKAAFSNLEHELDITLRRKVIVEEPSDFVRPEVGFIQLMSFPLISVQRVQMVLPHQAPMIDYPLTSIYPDYEAAHLRIVPAPGQVIQGAWNYWVSAIGGGVDSIPDVWVVDYTAGFERGAVPEALLDIVGKLAALELLGIGGDLVLGAGVAGETTRVDELMTEIRTTKGKDSSAYEARIKRYLRDIANRVPSLRRYYKGIRAVIC